MSVAVLQQPPLIPAFMVGAHFVSAETHKALKSAENAAIDAKAFVVKEWAAATASKPARELFATAHHLEQWIKSVYARAKTEGHVITEDIHRFFLAHIETTGETIYHDACAALANLWHDSNAIEKMVDRNDIA